MALHFLLDDCASAAVGDEVTLGGAEAKHAAVVRRVRPGEQVTLGDGHGVWLEGVVQSAEASRVVVQIAARRVEPQPSVRMILAQALAKGDRDELAVQAACELGVDEVIPWQASRSISRWEGPKARKGQERWQSIVREAAKQAHRAWVPAVSEAHSTKALITRSKSARLLVLDPWAEATVSTLTPDDRDVVLVVGPEGGISPEELDAFTQAGAERVRLGTTVLRTSTAGPAAISVLSAVLGRW